jgi:hypothetical protein
MRAALLVAATSLVALSCSPANPRPTPAATPPPTPTVSTATIEQILDRCPSPADLASVDASVSMTFTSDPSAGQLVCTAAKGSRDLTRLQERAYQAVLMFTWIRFDTPLPWTNLALDAWFAQAIHGVDFRSDGPYSYCCAAGGVIVIQTPNLAVLSPTKFYDPDLKIVRDDIWGAVRGLAALFIHEARHNQGYLHTCTMGPRAGQNDNTIAELGAWGVEYYFLLWLGTHSNPVVVPEKFRLTARRDAEGMPATVFCNRSPSPTP